MALRSLPRWRAIAEIVHPWRRSACASMSSARVIMSGGLLRAGVWSETTSLEGAPPGSAEPRGRGISVSRSGEVHLSVVTGAQVGTDEAVAGGGADAVPAAANLHLELDRALGLFGGVAGEGYGEVG